jgi:hypothetical protein
MFSADNIWGNQLKTPCYQIEIENAQYYSLLDVVAGRCKKKNLQACASEVLQIIS